MIQELAGRELSLFLASCDKVAQLIEEDRAYLQARADEGNVSEAYLRKRNYQLGLLADHIGAGDKLLQALGLVLPLLAVDLEEARRTKFQLQELRDENERLRIYLKAKGGDPELLPFIRKSDYQYA